MEKNSTDIHWIGFLRSISRKKLFLTIFYGIARIVISTAWPFLLYRGLQKEAKNPTGEIAIILVTVTAMFVLSAIVSHQQTLTNLMIMKEFSLNIVERLWKKLNSLEWIVFHGKSRVYYFDMFMVEAWRVRHGMIALLESIIINTIVACSLTLFILFISRPLFILCAVGMALTALVHVFSTVKVKPYLRHFHKAWSNQHEWIAKVIDQFDLVKMNRAYQESDLANKENTTVFLESNYAMLRNQSMWGSINQLAGNVIRVFIFIIGIYWIQTKYVTLPDLIFVLLIVSVIQNYMAQIPSSVISFIEGQESAGNINAFFLLPGEQANDPQPITDMPVINTIDIKGLSLSYEDKQAINDIDLYLEKGKIYLWKGKNGSGKSTTAHILLGLLNPQKGSIAINGETIDWPALKQLKGHFAFVNQDAPIFRGNVKENILFGHAEPQQAWDNVYNTWLKALLPSGKEADNRMVGDRGEGLSGGEARRMALIREWLRASQLFILDEPLNHLDEHSINEIKREILNIKKNAIVIIVSHQPGFETIADEIKQF